MTKFADLLVDRWVALPLQAETLEGALREILLRVHRAGDVSEERALDLAGGVAGGSAGEVHPVNDDVVVALALVEGLDGPSVAVGVSRDPFEVLPARDGFPNSVRAVVLVLTPASLTGVRRGLLPELTRTLRDPGRTERLLAARSVAELRGIRELMETEWTTPVLVEDALVPVQYRVYPDTPLEEVLDLVVRRGIRAIPVVGEQYEVLGILTSGDALGHLLRRGRPGGEARPEAAGRQEPRARDVMTRTVLCVSEDQGLLDAANMMVNRDVEQLPVVREGELVGFVTRDSILRALHGAPSDEPDDDNESEPQP